MAIRTMSRNSAYGLNFQPRSLILLLIVHVCVFVCVCGCVCMCVCHEFIGVQLIVPPVEVRVHDEGALPWRVDVLPDGGGANHSPLLL